MPHSNAPSSWFPNVRALPMIERLRRRGPILMLVIGLQTGIWSVVSPAARAEVEIAPHRAIYAMSLRSARNNSSITDVRGKMLFQWADACDGWTIEQRFDLSFLYAESEEVEMELSFATWEAKDGLSYRFNMRKHINKVLDEDVRGEASLDRPGGPGRAVFDRPEPRTMRLPSGVLFPSRHTVALIERAQAGDTLFFRRVFDGADTEGASDISAAILGQETEIATDLDDQLLKGPLWMVRLAFFPIKTPEGLPEYELSLRLLENGVAEAMIIDYGDFAVDVTLDTIEALPESGC